MIEVRLLRAGDAWMLQRVADDVCDAPVTPGAVTAVLSAPYHGRTVARDGDLVVGMASAQAYLRPDKPKEMWINEVGVAPAWDRAPICGLSARRGPTRRMFGRTGRGGARSHRRAGRVCGMWFGYTGHGDDPILGLDVAAGQSKAMLTAPTRRSAVW